MSDQKMRDALEKIADYDCDGDARGYKCGGCRTCDARAALAERPAQGEAVAESTRTAPERIWLCLSDEEGYEHMAFPRCTSEVTWAENPVVHVTVEYLRADQAPPAPSVPDEHQISDTQGIDDWEGGYHEGWNACRAAMLAAPEVPRG